MKTWRGRKPVIGLMGGIGSGKSRVAGMFAAHGCAVIDADALAREALDEPAVVENIKSWWGSRVVDDEGRVDRKAVARIVFADPAELRRLEQLTHPLVLARRAEQRVKYMADPSVLAIIDDTPLLIEKGLDRDCDVLIFVDAPFEVRLERVTRTRGWARDELRSREKMQTPLDIKRQRADYVLQNGADVSGCEAHVQHVLSQILQRDAR